MLSFRARPPSSVFVKRLLVARPFDFCTKLPETGLHIYIYVYIYVYIYIISYIYIYISYHMYICVLCVYIYIYILCIYVLCIYVLCIYVLCIYVLCIYVLCIYVLCIYVLCIYVLCVYIWYIYIYSYIYSICIYIYCICVYIYMFLHSFTDEEASFYISKRALPTLILPSQAMFFGALLRPLGFKAQSLTELSTAPDAKSDPSGDNAKLLTSPPSEITGPFWRRWAWPFWKGRRNIGWISRS